MPQEAIALIIINLGLIWLLMAAPLGRRTIRVRKHFDAPLERVWSAINPLGRNASWHPSVINSTPLAGNQVRHTHSNLDRHGQPIELTYEVDANDATTSYSARVVEDTALDPDFWRNYKESCTLSADSDGTDMVLERTDNYRGLAFYIFRYFSLRRETKALGNWLNGRSVSLGGVFERPSMQVFLAVVSTLLLWPFLGMNLHGLVLSTMLTVVIVMHELGHLIAYRAFGHKRVRMIFIPLLGGLAMGGRPYNSRFEIAVCAIMGAGLSGFVVPIVVSVSRGAGNGHLPALLREPALLFLLILGAFNLLNLLPMRRFDGGQAIRQVFRSQTTQMVGSFLIAAAILATGWEVGVSGSALVIAVAVFAILSFVGHGDVKPRHVMLEMSDPERLMAGLGLYAAVLIHAYAIIVACEGLFGV